MVDARQEMSLGNFRHNDCILAEERVSRLEDMDLVSPVYARFIALRHNVTLPIAIQLICPELYSG